MADEKKTTPQQFMRNQGSTTRSKRNVFPTRENCPLCRGTGCELEDGKVRDCVCAVERKIESRLPPRYRFAALSDFSDAMRDAVVGWLSRPTDGLLITGSVGTGKTHLAAAIARSILEAGKDAAFQRFGNFYADLREAVRTGESERLVFGPLERAGFLILDDLGAGSLSDHERRSTLEVIERRLIEYRPTVVTTNWSLGKISELIDDRVASRLSAYTAIELSGSDLRVHRRGRAGAT